MTRVLLKRSASYLKTISYFFAENAFLQNLQYTSSTF